MRVRARMLVWAMVLLVSLGLAGAVAGDAGRATLVPTGMTAVEPVQSPWAPGVPTGDWVLSTRSRELASPLRRSPLESAEERLLRIADHAVTPIEIAEPERSRRRAASLQAAALYEAAGDWQAARFAYERAVALGADDLRVWRSLARVRLLAGDGPGAEAAQLAALEQLGQTTGAVAFVALRAKIHRDLAKLYLLEGRDRDARIALEAAGGLSASSPAVVEWLARSCFPLDLSPPPVANAPAPVWPEAPSPSWLERASSGLRRGYAALPPEAQDVVASGAAWLDQEPRRSLAAPVGLGLLFLFVLLRLIRQRGDLIVAIEYPEELRGVFRVRLSSTRGRGGQPSARSFRSEVLKGGVSTHHEHHFVNRETHFHRLLAHRYYVMVEGVLLDPATDEILGEFTERKMVRVRHRRTVRLDYDAHPETCPVDVAVVWDDKPAEDVAVVAREVPESMRRSKDHSVRLFLPKGQHRLVVGCGDRVMEQPLLVESFQPTRVEIDLAGGEVVFKGCPPAVEPYLRNDIETVARALERDGQAERAYLMLAKLNRDRGEGMRAADYFESAGHVVEAADLRRELADHLRAAKLYMQANRPLDAAEMYRAAGDLVQAGQAYEDALDFDRAIACYRDVGAVSRWIGALERRGETFQAAKVALDKDQRPRAIRLLQCIVAEDPDYAEACWLLAAAFEREEHFDLAAQKLEQHLATYPRGTAPADKYARLADLHEQAGGYERALEVLEDLRRREPTYPGVAARIEHLNKQRSAASRITRTSEEPATGAAATAFVSEYRYEVLEEIGRGGMGVVFKARDRRLDRIVALKRLLEDLRRHQSRAVQLFLREAQAAARLNHPNIVTVYDADQEDGVFFITMELLDGEPFHKILKEQGRLSPAHALEVGMQVASGLQYAHEQGIIHRDVKTANLFLTTEQVVKIMDFGLAKMFEEVRGATTIISGTPFYMSPEQIVGGDVDQRTDLYSLGVTLFELVTGQVPFSQGDIAYHHRHAAPPDPRDLVPEIPDGFADVLLELLAKDPAERCPSAEALLSRFEQLQTVLRGEG